jgi:pimeloyl-ACP methyl ester carboxylesterase
VLARYPVGRLFDLFTLQDVAWSVVPLVKTPALVVAAVHDHVIALDGVRELHAALPGARLLELQRGFHILPRDTDRALLAAEVAEFLEAPATAAQ